MTSPTPPRSTAARAASPCTAGSAETPHVRRRPRPRLRRARRPLRPRRAGAGRRRRRRLRGRPPRPWRVRGRARARRGHGGPRRRHGPRRRAGPRRAPRLPVVLIGHSLGGLVATRYAPAPTTTGSPRSCSRRRSIGGNPDLLGLRRTCPRSPTSRSTRRSCRAIPRSARAYAADELVYHGPFKRADAAGDRRLDRRGRGGPETSATCRRCGSTATEDFLAPIGQAPPGGRAASAAPCSRSSIYQGARHEVFNETNQRRGHRRRARLHRALALAGESLPGSRPRHRREPRQNRPPRTPPACRRARARRRSSRRASRCLARVAQGCHVGFERANRDQHQWRRLMLVVTAMGVMIVSPPVMTVGSL